MSHPLLLAAEGKNGFLLPHDTNEIIWGSIAFLIVLGLLIKFAGPAIKNGLTSRTERLAKELDDAAAAKAEAQTKLADVQHRIADAGNERQRILDEAATTAASLKAQLQAKADSDADAQHAQLLLVDGVETVPNAPVREDSSQRTSPYPRRSRSSEAPASAMTLTSALPTTAASAQRPTSRTCSGFEIPKPRATGRSLTRRMRCTISCAPSARRSRAPVTPRREIA